MNRKVTGALPGWRRFAQRDSLPQRDQVAGLIPSRETCERQHGQVGQWLERHPNTPELWV